LPAQATGNGPRVMISTFRGVASREGRGNPKAERVGEWAGRMLKW